MRRDCRGCLLLAIAIAAYSACARTAEVAPSADHAVDAVGMDRSTRPGDDFFKYANGKWDQDTAIPPDRAAWGLDSSLDEQALGHTRALLEAAANQSAAGSDERKAADYFAAYMD